MTTGNDIMSITSIKDIEYDLRRLLDDPNGPTDVGIRSALIDAGLAVRRARDTLVRRCVMAVEDGVLDDSNGRVAREARQLATAPYYNWGARLHLGGAAKGE